MTLGSAVSDVGRQQARQLLEHGLLLVGFFYERSYRSCCIAAEKERFKIRI